MKIKNRHPVQPVIQDEHGVHRCKQNAIVRFLLDDSKHDLNDLARMVFTDEDREQFSQLIGYSVKGMMYFIEMAWFCWDCAENIGFPFVEAQRKRTPEDKCYSCESSSWTEQVNRGLAHEPETTG